MNFLRIVIFLQLHLYILLKACCVILLCSYQPSSNKSYLHAVQTITSRDQRNRRWTRRTLRYSEECCSRTARTVTSTRAAGTRNLTWHLQHFIQAGATVTRIFFIQPLLYTVTLLPTVPTTSWATGHPLSPLMLNRISSQSTENHRQYYTRVLQFFLTTANT